ncbi:glucose--fructose oxidoreductase precursor [bacterium BMS3Abin10]|nr:glucose--fructose oxidoreductase precursor [bacterium BMS3Abin10]GBE39181.1 glucose--fructose oxidoreductase precursor [bacterium BMS3Bbin08]
MAKQEIKFAVLGFGGAGVAHVRRLSSIGGVRVVKVYDTKLEKVKKIVSKYKEITFTDRFEDILDGSVDAVSICTPDHTHFEYAVQTVKNGLHTLVEKPMFVSYRECEKMESVLRSSDVVFGVHHQMRYIPAFRAAHDLVQSGYLGDIIVIEADYIHDMRKRATLYDDWRIDKSYPQNIVLGGMSHTLDLMRWLVGEEVEEICAISAHKGWKDYPDVDTVVATLRFKSDTIGKGTITISSSGPQRNTIAIYGTKGQIHNNIFRDADGHVSFTVKSDLGRKMNVLSKPFTWFLKQEPSILRDYPFSIYEHEIACKTLLLDFVLAIRTGKPFPAGFDIGRSAVQLCLACIEAYKSRGKVTLTS